MAVNIKSLRIGSHVEYNGKRVRVEQLSTIRLLNEPMSVLVSHNDSPEAYANIGELDPMPLTPELLKELGFEFKDYGYNELWWHGGFNLTHDKDSVYWDFERRDIRLEFLHELEILYYLIYGIELIKD